ncbi:hypothetical protein N7507_002289 [Penicillium longicatenatum]|nr:hypothetical protein N7507_002289 [Penicillium longicatenatum]
MPSNLHTNLRIQAIQRALNNELDSWAHSAIHLSCQKSKPDKCEHRYKLMLETKWLACKIWTNLGSSATEKQSRNNSTHRMFEILTEIFGISAISAIDAMDIIGHEHVMHLILLKSRDLNLRLTMLDRFRERLYFSGGTSELLMLYLTAKQTIEDDHGIVLGSEWDIVHSIQGLSGMENVAHSFGKAQHVTFWVLVCLAVRERIRMNRELNEAENALLLKLIIHQGGKLSHDEGLLVMPRKASLHHYAAHKTEANLANTAKHLGRGGMEGSFRCQRPGCTRSYLRKEHLRRHERDHANARPFTCQDCPSTFNRRDLLNRHRVLNHGNLQPSADKPHPEGAAASKRSKPNDDHSTASVGESATSEIPNSNPANEMWYLDLSSTPAEKLLDATNRRQLEELYFGKFHPHWPILHQQTFKNSAQPPTLSIAVLIAGLWMMGTPETRQEAKLYHDAILTELNRKLVRTLSIIRLSVSVVVGNC